MSGSTVQVISLSRNCNEAVLLAILSEGPLHGYQIALKSAELTGEYFAFKHGTLYPILHSLEKRGLIEGVWNGKKKAYTLTGNGKVFRDELRQSWNAFTTAFLGVIDGGE